MVRPFDHGSRCLVLRGVHGWPGRQSGEAGAGSSARSFRTPWYTGQLISCHRLAVQTIVLVRGRVAITTIFAVIVAAMVAVIATLLVVVPAVAVVVAVVVAAAAVVAVVVFVVAVIVTAAVAVVVTVTASQVAFSAAAYYQACLCFGPPSLKAHELASQNVATKHVRLLTKTSLTRARRILVHISLRRLNLRTLEMVLQPREQEISSSESRCCCRGRSCQTILCGMPDIQWSRRSHSAAAFPKHCHRSKKRALDELVHQ